ncbi:hypothetical protein BDW74DRAFT_41786 [Aspergillus multicolor]|uniref:ankyrin repeat domain-containing protein n=1 Tax=Aspergillus multicolor TaxID=41759 RepID=UPI003CCE25E0
MHIIEPYIDPEIRAIARQNSRKALEAFIYQKRQMDPEYSPPLDDLLQCATDSRADEVAAYCLEHGQKATRGVLTSVIVHNSFAVFRVMVEHKAVPINCSVPWYGDILGVMARGNKIDWVRFCLEHGADPNVGLVEEHLRPLACAVHTGNYELVDLLLHYGARVEGSNAIVQAAIDEDLDMVKYLLSRGANIDEVGIEGPPGDEGYYDMGSPLHQAAVEGYPEMARFLIEAGADIYLKDPLGRTAEELARAKGHREILEALRRRRKELEDSVEVEG